MAVIVKIWNGTDIHRVRLPSKEFRAAWDAVWGAAVDSAGLEASLGTCNGPYLNEASWNDALTKVRAETAPSPRDAKASAPVIKVFLTRAPHVPKVEEAPVGSAAAKRAAKAAAHKVQRMHMLWLPMLKPGELSKAAVLECRSHGTTLRVAEGGYLDAWGCVGSRATFIVQPVAAAEGVQVVTLRCVAGGFVRFASCASGHAGLVLAGESADEDCMFELVPSWKGRFSGTRKLAEQEMTTYGVALRMVVTGQFVDLTEAGEVTLARPALQGEEQPAELFIFRYQPRYDEAWMQDGQYEGRRRWVRCPDKRHYSFKEFIAFTSRQDVFVGNRFRYRGLVAAKVLWATSVEEGASEQEVEAALRLNRILDDTRQWSSYERHYLCFADMLTSVEARGLRIKGKTDIDSVKTRWDP